MKKDLLFTIKFNDAPAIGSVMIGDAEIHSQLTDYVQLGVHYDRVLGELKNIETLTRNNPLLALLERMTRTKTHTNDFFKETFGFETQALFQRAGTYSDPTAVKTRQVSWEIGIEDFESKVMDMNQVEIKKLNRNKVSVLPQFQKALDRVIRTYVTKLLPNLYYRALFKPVKDGGEYQDNFGLLRNVTVDQFMLLNVDSNATAGAYNSIVRNHFRAIKTPSTVPGTLGLTPEDIREAKKYLLNYEDNGSKEIVAITTSKIINTLTGFYNYQPTKDAFLQEGVTSIKIEGIHFVEADFIVPEDFIFFGLVDFDVESGHLLTKVINPNSEYQGIYLDIEGNNFGWESVTDHNLKDVKLVVGDINIELTGRYRGLWLDCGNRPQTDGLMTTEGHGILARRYEQIQKQIYYK